MTNRAPDEKSIKQGTGIAIAGLILGMTLIGFLATGESKPESAGGKDSAPFYADRVVTVRLVMHEEVWERMQKSALAKQYVKADMWYDGKLVQDVAVRTKGHLTLARAIEIGSMRFALNVDLNFFNSSRSLNGVKKLDFNNGYIDASFIREVLAYGLYAEMGIPTPRTSFVDLWLNDTHLGLYTMVEHIDGTYLGNNFADSTGNLYKPELPGGSLNWTHEEPAPLGQTLNVATGTPDINMGGGKLSQIRQALESPGSLPAPPASESTPKQQQDYVLDTMGLKTNENRSNHQALFRLLEVINKEPDKTFPAEIEKVLDVNEMLRFMAVSAVLLNTDTYMGEYAHNYYLYEIDGKFIIIVWDLNMAFGTYSAGLPRQKIIDYYIDEPILGPTAERPLAWRLLSVPAYRETYHSYIKELIDGPFSYEAMAIKIDRLSNLVRPYVKADNLKFYSTDEFERSLSEDISAFDGMYRKMIFGLKLLVADRTESIRKQLAGKIPSMSPDGKGNQGNIGLGAPQASQGGRPSVPPTPAVAGAIGPHAPIGGRP